jgi:F-type H+-transporting ATPase subunit delta
MNQNVAARYAKALLAITKQKGVHAEALSQLKDIAQSFSNPELKEFFNNPVVTPAQKANALKAALTGKQFLEEVVSVILLMADRGRLTAINEFVQAFQDGLDEEGGITRGVVRAAKPLNKDSQAELEKKINQVLKKKIVLTFKEDPSLLGGVVAQVGGWTFDDSIETHLKKLNEELNRGAY